MRRSRWGAKERSVQRLLRLNQISTGQIKISSAAGITDEDFIWHYSRSMSVSPFPPETWRLL